MFPRHLWTAGPKDPPTGQPSTHTRIHAHARAHAAQCFLIRELAAVSAANTETVIYSAEISERGERDKNKRTKTDGGMKADSGRRVFLCGFIVKGTVEIFTFVLCCLYERNTFLRSILNSLRRRQILHSPPVRARVHAAPRARRYQGFGGMLGQANCAFGVRAGPSEHD